MAPHFSETSASRAYCYHHAGRQAVVRCPDCGRYYCRECVTEHEDRMLCTGCLQAYLAGGRIKKRPWIRGGAIVVQGISGFVLLWYGFFLLGRILLAIPSAFHEGTLWQNLGWLIP